MTTNSNLGCKNGAAIVLEHILKTSLLYLPCRHHIFELILGCIFNVKLSATSEPDVPLFLKFKSAWNDIDQSKYRTGVSDKNINKKLSKQIKNIDVFTKKFLHDGQPRDDYKELLLLARVFLGLDISVADRY